MALNLKGWANLDARENSRGKGTWEQIHYVFRGNKGSTLNRDEVSLIREVELCELGFVISKLSTSEL